MIVKAVSHVLYFHGQQNKITMMLTAQLRVKRWQARMLHVSREFMVITLPILYHSIHVKLSRNTIDGSFSRISDIEKPNLGLQFVKVLEFAVEFERHWDWSTQYPTALYLLKFLPRDKLEYFL